MFEVIDGPASAARPQSAPSLARSAEFQAALVGTIQAMRNAPAILHALDLDELRQLGIAAEQLSRQCDYATQRAHQEGR